MDTLVIHSKVLNLSFAILCGCFASLCLRASQPRIETLTIPDEGRTGFQRLAGEQTGIVFTNLLGESRAATNRNLLTGSGVAAGDADGDGRTDLYFCGLDNNNALYRNLGGWKFEDVTAVAGVGGEGWDATGAVFADVDGDRDLDLLVNVLDNGTHLFRNDGKGVFELVADSGLRGKTGGTSMALADIDGDSDLDLYVANFRPTTIRDAPRTKFGVEYVKGQPVVVKVDGRPATAPDLTNRFAVAPSGEVMEFGEADVLYENDGMGRFTAISWTSGRFKDEHGQPLREAPGDWGLAVQFYDFTGDGAPDIYVCNDYWTPDRIWINDGKGSFQAVPAMAFRSISRSSMGVDFADIDRDGDADCFVVEMLARNHRDRQIQVNELPSFFLPPGRFDIQLQLSQNTVQLNRGDGTFAQIGEFCGLEASEWSWCPIFLDVDLDGWEDVLISNGHRRDFQNADAAGEIQRALAAKRIPLEPASIMGFFPRLNVTKGAFRNNRDLTFSEAAEAWGLAYEDISHGFCTADLDGDGDLDLAMNNLGTGAGIYRNESKAPRIAVRLVGSGKNTAAVGARITVRGDSVEQSQEIIAGGRYLSGDAMERVFAAPSTPVALEVRWPNGKTSSIQSPLPNHRYTVSE